MLVIGKTSGLPGVGYTARTMTGTDTRDVLAYAWTDLPNPFDYASRGESLKEMVKRVLDSPVSASEVYALIKQRGLMQNIFRLALLDAYRGRCAFSGSTLPETLEAAHIVPWSEADEEERFDVRNGILLNAYYHRLFDAYLLIVGADYQITPGPALDPSALSDFDQQAIRPVLGQRLKLPRHRNYFPGRDYLERRNTSRGTA